MGKPVQTTASDRWIGAGMGQSISASVKYPMRDQACGYASSPIVEPLSAWESWAPCIVWQPPRRYPRGAPADVLLELYHERWEVELVIDEIKTHERAQRRVLRSKTPDGVIQEIYGIFLAHYAVRAMMTQAPIEADVDPDRVSFTRGMFQLVEMIAFSLTLEEEATPQLVQRLLHHITRELLSPRVLRVNRREIKQIYNKYKPKKRGVPPPEPFEPEDRFLDFVELLDPLAPRVPEEVLK